MAEIGKIVNGFYVQGDLKFAVDANDAHKTFDAVAALSNADKIKLAQLNNIRQNRSTSSFSPRS
jgi:ribosomal 30S subunit maturation factor RimM